MGGNLLSRNPPPIKCAGDIMPQDIHDCHRRLFHRLSDSDKRLFQEAACLVVNKRVWRDSKVLVIECSFGRVRFISANRNPAINDNAPNGHPTCTMQMNSQNKPQCILHPGNDRSMGCFPRGQATGCMGQGQGQGQGQAGCLPRPQYVVDCHVDRVNMGCMGRQY